MNYKPKPCKCGISHQENDGNYEFFDMRMTAENSLVQLPLRKTARCKFCKEVLVVQREDDRKHDVLEDLFTKHHNIPSSFTIEWY